MSSLEILDISRNSIKSFPENAGSLTNLQVRFMWICDYQTDIHISSDSLCLEE
jgi:hypothetical protein